MTIDRIPKSENQYIEFKSENVKAIHYDLVELDKAKISDLQSTF